MQFSFHERVEILFSHVLYICLSTWIDDGMSSQALTCTVIKILAMFSVAQVTSCLISFILLLI